MNEIVDQLSANHEAQLGVLLACLLLGYLVRSIWSDSLGIITPGVLMEGRYFLADVRDRTKIRSIVFKELLSELRKNGIPLPETGHLPHLAHE
jgi:hypothetical protein